MNNLVEIQGQIEKLQKQADEIRIKEFDKTVQDILARMSAFGITLKDLQGPKGGAKSGRSGGKRSSAGKSLERGSAGNRASSTASSAKARAKGPSARAGIAVAAKFRGPNGESWTGRGLMPRWLTALVAQGRQKEEFAIAPV